MPLAPFVQLKTGKLNPNGTPITSVGINPVKQHVKGYWLVSDPITFSLTAVAPEVELKYLIDSQGHFDWAYLIGNSNNPFMLEFFDPGTQRRLSNKPVHSTTVMGSARRPFRLPEPYFFNVGDAQREMQIKVRRIAADVTNGRLILYGRRFYHKEAPPDVGQLIAKAFNDGWRTYSYFLVPKEYPQTGIPTAIAANGTETFTFDMDNSADTELQKLMSVSTGSFSFRIRERDTNRLLSNGSIINVNGWGNAEFPFLFADTYLLERQKQLLVEITDLSGAPNTVFLTMAGRRLQIR